MELDEIRREIDTIDAEILELFQKRMKLAEGVARFKKANNMPVFQAQREEEVLDRIADMSRDGMKNGSRLLFANIMDISKCIQQESLTEAEIPEIYTNKREKIRLACPGTEGSNSSEACRALFDNPEINHVETFDEVFQAVENGTVDYGVVPIENNTAGEVTQTYQLMNKHSFYIYKSAAIRINHVLAAIKGATLSGIETVFSHEQALLQCGEWLSSHSELQTRPYMNTALAAKMVRDSQNGKIAAICSESCARLYGLDILEKNIADNPENYTRFICISKRLEVSENADMISVALTTPHTAGALYRLLTRFAVNGLNLAKIENRPLPPDMEKSGEFDVMFYLDFYGSIKDLSVVKLLKCLESELNYYKFLGNFESTTRRE